MRQPFYHHHHLVLLFFFPFFVPCFINKRVEKWNALYNNIWWLVYVMTDSPPFTDQQTCPSLFLRDHNIIFYTCARKGKGNSPELRCGLGRVCPLSSPAWWDEWRNCCWETSTWDGWYRLSRECRKFTCTTGNVESRWLLFLLNRQLIQEVGHTRKVFFSDWSQV